MNISTTLREHRKAAGLTQQQLAEKADLHRNSYINYELGKRLPPIPVAFDLASILNTTLEILWPRESA